MRFCEALDDLQTMQDFRVRRTCWPKDEWLEAPDDKIILMRFVDNTGTAFKTDGWTPGQEDLFADDWEEIGEPEEVNPVEPVKADVLAFKPNTIEEALWPSSQSRRG